MPHRSENIALIVHGGAGDVPEDQRAEQQPGLEKALEAGWRLLESRESALDAVEAAVSVLEDDPAFNAGIGSVLRLDGSITLDASVMDGETRKAGAVAAVTRVRHPVSLARHVLHATKHVLLVGRWAEDLVDEARLERIDPRELVTPREIERLRRIREKLGAPGPHGTVGAVARDGRGHIAAATSTGGAPGSLPGRVGDTPIIGAGTFADDRAGGASSTGFGENIIVTALAREAARRMGAGESAAGAARWAVDYLRAETGGSCGIICIGRSGAPGAAFNTPWMGSLWRCLP